MDFAESIHADLIAMSTHGCNGLPHWALGSVAEKVARTSSVPVLLIHPTAISLPRLDAALRGLN